MRGCWQRANAAQGGPPPPMTDVSIRQQLKEEHAFSAEDVRFRSCFVDGSSYLSFKIWPGEIKYGCVLHIASPDPNFRHPGGKCASISFGGRAGRMIG